MIDTISFDDKFIEKLKQSKPSKYDICFEGALMHIYEQSCFMNTLRDNILSEATVTVNTDDIKNAAKKAVSSKNILKVIWNVLDLLSKIIRESMKVIMSILKKFLYIAKDTELSNNDFLKKYRAKLYELSNVNVEISGYKMNANMNGLAYSIEDDNLFKSFNDAKSIVIGNKEVFKTPDAVVDYIASTRSTILDNLNYHTPINNLRSDKEWYAELRFAIFGSEKPNKKTYSVQNALDCINNYDNAVLAVKNLIERTNRDAERDIRNINGIKNLATNNSNTNEVVIKQLDMLSKYRNTIMQDLIYVYEIVMEYITKINSQAKAICIKAMQEN